MSQPNIDNCITMHSDGTAIGQYVAVTKDAAGLMDLPTAAGRIIGIAQSGVAAADLTSPVSVCVTGITYGLAGGVLNRGVAGTQPLMIDATGRFALHTVGAARAHVANLLPSESDAAIGNTAAGDRIRVMLVNNPLFT